ncbi:hypothetical protein KC19_6G153400 [Ceratodon purpureus]|uniref:Phosphotyrosine protein phosphatase I domain-containing protein n=1 Tax=Ceratodon purpureus TaxID=3225 RepID=A0A8T0HI92_CERPU|nr:hypothetical protein KC19_6G153400 [Ceratodon purpureus]
MYTCRVLVKHGVTLVGGVSSPRENLLATASDASVSGSTAASHSSGKSSVFSVRSLASSFSHLGARQAAPYGSQMERRSAGNWHTFRASLVSSRGPAHDRNESSVFAVASAREGVEFAQESPAAGEESPPKFDVSSNCVTPVFRVSPFIQKTSDLENTKVRVLFLSEGNVCRSVYAEAIFNSLIEENGMQDFVECASKASRDYNAGESPDPRAVVIAEEIGLKLPEGATARVFECQSDIVLFDLLVVMDKFNASDVLKEVTVYEAIDKEARYTHKVRRLAEFCRTKKMDDIDDPLYGNMGGPEELALLREAYEDIRASCIGLMQTIIDIKAGLQDSESLKQGVGKSLGEMESLDWLVPPMLQKAEMQRR